MGLLGWLRRSTPKLDAEGLSDALVREATDYIVRLCDPRIALLPRYRERLAPAVVCALRFVRRHRELLGLPIDANTAAWHNTPLLRAIFATAEEMQLALGRCHELVEWFENNPTQDEVLATLGMSFKEQTTLGLVLQGDLLQHDVAQTTLSFSNHRARILSNTLESLWRGVARRLVDELAFIALSRFEVEQSRRKMLEEDLSLLRARLRAFERRGVGIDHLMASSTSSSVETRKLLHQLENNERKLAQMGGSDDLLELHLSILTETLFAPEKNIHIEKRSALLDTMNHVVEPGTPDSRLIEFVTVRADRQPPMERVLVALRIHRSAVQSAGLRLDDAARLLG